MLWNWYLGKEWWKDGKEANELCEKYKQYFKKNITAFEVVKITDPTLGSQLFKNFDKSNLIEEVCNKKCLVCKIGARGDEDSVVSSVTQKRYYINPNIGCKNSGIYAITCKCIDQYSGKTTITNGGRFKEHCTKCTSVHSHLQSCKSRPSVSDIKVQFLENVWDRGKYSLSEREYLWNKRLKGNINIQKTIARC